MDEYFIDPNRSQSKLLIYWKVKVKGFDSMTYHSYESIKTLENKDVKYGLGRLLNLVMEPPRFQNIARAIFYDRLSNTEILIIERDQVIFIANNLADDVWRVILLSPVGRLVVKSNISP